MYQANPGPGAYDPNLDTVCNRHPKYSVPKDKKESGSCFPTSGFKTPGAADYTLDLETIKGKRPEHAFGIKHDRKTALDPTPAGANYDIDKAFANAGHKAQSFTKQVVKREIQDVPGPAAYTPIQGAHKERVPAYSMRKQTLKPETASMTPSPATYENNKIPVYHTITPGKTISFRPEEARVLNVPAACAYNHDQTKSNPQAFDGPKYTMRPNYRKARMLPHPGPAEYDPAHAQQKVISKTMSAKSLNGSVFQTNKNPGPADYNPKRLARTSSAPAFTHMDRPRHIQKDPTPGPSSYNNEKVKRCPPAYSMGGKNKPLKDDCGPGPAPPDRNIDKDSYHLIKPKNPGYSMRARTATKDKSSLTPGPGSYFSYEKDVQVVSRSASQQQIRDQRGLVFGLPGNQKQMDANPGPGSYSPYDFQSLGRSGSSATLAKGKLSTRDKQQQYARTLRRSKSKPKPLTTNIPSRMAVAAQ